jgi:hypothetical protein
MERAHDSVVAYAIARVAPNQSAQAMWVSRASLQQRAHATAVETGAVPRLRAVGPFLACLHAAYGCICDDIHRLEARAEPRPGLAAARSSDVADRNENSIVSGVQKLNAAVTWTPGALPSRMQLNSSRVHLWLCVAAVDVLSPASSGAANCTERGRLQNFPSPFSDLSEHTAA